MDNARMVHHIGRAMSAELDRRNPYLLLREVGTVLYGTGPDRKDSMVEALKVSDRRYRRWINGEQPIPAGIWDELVALLDQEIGKGGSQVDALHRLRHRIQDLIS
jgi:hypothetical protein